MEPTERVRQSAQFIHENSSRVRIDFARFSDYMDWIQKQKYKEYDEIYHPSSEELGFEESLAFIFFVDAVNFCFWPYHIEYGDVCELFRSQIKSGKFSCQYFLTASEEELNESLRIFHSEENETQFVQRKQNLREVS